MITFCMASTVKDIVHYVINGIAKINNEKKYRNHIKFGSYFSL